MTVHRFAAKRDAIEPTVIGVLEAHGFSVTQLSGRGIPDLLLGKWRITLVAEVKSGAAALTPPQQLWWSTWNGNPLIVLRSIADVERFVYLFDHVFGAGGVGDQMNSLASTQSAA